MTDKKENMRNLILYLFIISLCVGCSVFNGYKFSNDEFSAVFQSKPDIKSESFDENGKPILTFYETSTRKNSFLTHQHVSIDRLSTEECKLSSKEKIETIIDFNRRKENSEEYFSLWKSFKLQNGVTKNVKYLDYSTLRKGKISKTFHKQIYLDNECSIYSIIVFGSSKDKVDDVFEQFSKSFALKRGKVQ